MNRRHLLVGAGSLGALVGGAVFVTRGRPWDGDSSEPTDDGSSDDADDGRGGTGSDEPPFELRTIESTGSEEGSVTVPDSQWLTVLNFTRTACPTSEGFLENLANARERVEDDSVRFVSILEYGRDPTDADEEFAEWWADNDGEWTLAIDDTGHVVEYYGGSNTPTTILVGGDGTVHWTEVGTPSASTIRAAIDAAIESGDGAG